MNEKLETKKFVFTVEGETEQWYFEWLRDQINMCENRKYNAAVDVKVQQNPGKFYKTVNAKTVPEAFHICDMESNERVHVDKFKNILTELKDADKNAGWVRYNDVVDVINEKVILRNQVDVEMGNQQQKMLEEMKRMLDGFRDRFGDLERNQPIQEEIPTVSKDDIESNVMGFAIVMHVEVAKHSYVLQAKVVVLSV